ncbi:MAG: nucleotidyltransferase domain-containing protein [Candidatus Hydrogenedentes bacterium]|nr:nucleotidyltransferase domain-containing protein [Candidatus Hydrogenedentota bacterium]
MNAILADRSEDLQALCSQYHVERLELFGSAVGDTFDPERSDFDFLVRFEPSSPEDHADRYFGLLAALQDLLERNVDLVESTAIRNPFFLRSVESSRTLIYGT